MKKTIKKQTVIDANELFNVIEQRKTLEKREKELKASFKELLGEETAIDANGILISVTSRERKSLDKKALSKVIDLSDFESIKEYQVMSVSKVG